MKIEELTREQAVSILNNRQLPMSVAYDFYTKAGGTLPLKEFSVCFSQYLNLGGDVSGLFRNIMQTHNLIKDVDTQRVY